MPPPRIAFVTCAQYPHLTADDQLAARALTRMAVEVIPALWRDPAVDWPSHDLVVLRSMWDYHLYPAEFDQWLGRLEQGGVRVLNPLPTARWNADKHYLRDLAERGVAVVPTEWFPRGSRPSVAEVMDRHGWREIVVKPTVSSTAFRTWRIQRAAADHHQTDVHALLSERAAMLQQYQPEIVTEGEWSVTFVDRRPTHVVLKKAAPGDFRVQEEFGGTTVLCEPDPDIVAAAARALAAVTGELLYARVDGVKTAHGFRVGELEVLEPGLFFLNHPPAAEAFAQAILKRI